MIKRTTTDKATPDDLLVAEFKRTGDMNLLAELFLRYSDMLHFVCMKYLKNPEDARDAVVEVFEQLAQRLQKHEVSNFRSWIYTVAKNHCLMQLRTPKNLKIVEFNGEIMHSQEELHLNGVMEKEESLVRLEDCIKNLAGEQKQAIELFYLQNKCYKEISEITGADSKAVRSFIQNGRRNLKICMEKKNASEKEQVEISKLRD